MATKRKRPPKAVIAVVVLLLIGGGIWWWWDSQANAETTTTETLSGSVEATQYQISPAIAGRVTKVLVAEGDTVTKDQEVVRLDRTSLKLTVKQAKQGVTAAKAALTNAKNDDDATKADVTAAKAKVKQAQAQVELAEAQLAYTIITVPQAGIVTAVTTNVGQNAAPAKTLVTVLDPTSLFARVYVAETEIGKVKVGQEVRVVTDSSTSGFKGTVSYIASEAQFTPNTIQTKEQRVKLVYEVRVRIADDGGTLKPGMPVDVTLS